MHFLSGRLLPVSGPLLPADISKNRLNTHSPKTPEVLFALHDIVRVKGDTFPGMISLSDHRPVPVVPLATNHPGKQVVIPLSGIFQVMKVPPGGLFFTGMRLMVFLPVSRVPEGISEYSVIHFFRTSLSFQQLKGYLHFFSL